jgi:hypothetical protein
MHPRYHNFGVSTGSEPFPFHLDSEFHSSWNDILSQLDVLEPLLAVTKSFLGSFKHSGDGHDFTLSIDHAMTQRDTTAVRVFGAKKTPVSAAFTVVIGITNDRNVRNAPHFLFSRELYDLIYPSWTAQFSNTVPKSPVIYLQLVVAPSGIKLIAFMKTSDHGDSSLTRSLQAVELDKSLLQSHVMQRFLGSPSVRAYFLTELVIAVLQVHLGVIGSFSASDCIGSIATLKDSDDHQALQPSLRGVKWSHVVSLLLQDIPTDDIDALCPPVASPSLSTKKDLAYSCLLYLSLYSLSLKGQLPVAQSVQKGARLLAETPLVTPPPATAPSPVAVPPPAVALGSTILVLNTSYCNGVRESWLAYLRNLGSVMEFELPDLHVLGFDELGLDLLQDFTGRIIFAAKKQFVKFATQHLGLDEGKAIKKSRTPTFIKNRNGARMAWVPSLSGRGSIRPHDIVNLVSAVFSGDVTVSHHPVKGGDGNIFYPRKVSLSAVHEARLDALRARFEDVVWKCWCGVKSIQLPYPSLLSSHPPVELVNRILDALSGDDGLTATQVLQTEKHRAAPLISVIASKHMLEVNAGEGLTLNGSISSKMRFVVDVGSSVQCIPWYETSEAAVVEAVTTVINSLSTNQADLTPILAERAAYVLSDIISGLLGSLLAKYAAYYVGRRGSPDLANESITTAVMIKTVLKELKLMAGTDDHGHVTRLYPVLKDWSLLPELKELYEAEAAAASGARATVGSQSALREPTSKEPTKGSEYIDPSYSRFTDSRFIPYATKLDRLHRLVQNAMVEAGMDPGQSFDSIAWCLVQYAFAVEVGLPALPATTSAQAALKRECKQHCHDELSAPQGSILPDRPLCPLCLTYVRFGERTNSQYIDMIVARNGANSRIPRVEDRRKVWSRSMSMDISTDTGASKSIDEVASARENFLEANPDIAAAYHARSELLSLVRRRKKDADFLAVIGNHFNGDQLQKDVNAIVAGETKTSLAKEEDDEDDGPEGEEANAAAQQLKGVDRTLTAAINAASKGDDRKLRRIVDAAKVVKDVAEGKPDEVLEEKIAAMNAAGGLTAGAEAMRKVEQDPYVRAAKNKAKARRKKAERGWREAAERVKQRTGVKKGDVGNGDHVLLYTGDAGTASASKPKKGRVRRHAGRAVMQTMSGVNGIHVVHTREGWTSRRCQCCGTAYNDYEPIPSGYASLNPTSQGTPARPTRPSYHRRVCLHCGRVTARDRGSAIAIMGVGRVRRVFGVTLWSKSTYELLFKKITATV